MMLAGLVCSAKLAIATPLATAVAQTSSDRSATQGRASPGKPPAPAAAPQATEPLPAQPRGRVYLFRGAMGLIFSRGMDRLAEKLARVDVTANVYEFTLCDLVTAAAIETYRQDPAPIILIGHSMGGRCALQFAEKLNDEGIPASLVVTIDPAHLSPDVPPNVERFINIFLSKDVLGGGDIKPAQGFRGHYASYDLAKHGEVSHITIDKMDEIHQQLVAKIVQLAATPAKAEGEIVPIRYVLPPKAEIELWDSGAFVAANTGGTLQTLAAQDHLPLWSLTQLNQMPENAPLIVGQRVVIPRHLVPLTIASKPVTSGR
jgi:predicted alpha/beta-hydrolase family hydrolase